MAAKTWATSYVCDGCGAEGTAAVKTPTESATPEGWHSLTGSGVEMRAANWYISDLCPDCQAVPFPELAARLLAQHAARFGPSEYITHEAKYGSV